MLTGQVQTATKAFQICEARSRTENTEMKTLHLTMVRFLLTWFLHRRDDNADAEMKMAITLAWATADCILALDASERAKVVDYLSLVLQRQKVEHVVETPQRIQECLYGDADFVSVLHASCAHVCLVRLFLYMHSVPQNREFILRVCSVYSEFRHSRYDVFLTDIRFKMECCLLGYERLPCLFALKAS